MEAGAGIAVGLADLLSPESRADPYPAYARLRAEGTVLPLDEGLWLVTCYEECRAVLCDPAWSSDVRNQREALARHGFRGRDTPVAPLLDGLMVFRDAPDHTRLRGLVQKAFSPRRIQALGPRVAEHVDALLDELLPRGEMDLIGDFASRLSVSVIAELLGVPAADRDRFRVWAEDLGVMFEPLFDTRAALRAGRLAQTFGEYFGRLIPERRRDPEDDLLTALVQVEDGGSRLSLVELISNCALILIAGHETTTSLIGNGVLALLDHPGELERLRADPGLAPAAVEELLRYDSPVQMTLRTALEDRSLAGTAIRAGDSVLLALGSANRDPARFDEPDRLDLGREDNRHLAFAAGPHYCLGNALGRLEAAHAFGALAGRTRGLARADGEPIAFGHKLALRGPEAVRLRFDPAA